MPPSIAKVPMLPPGDTMAPGAGHVFMGVSHGVSEESSEAPPFLAGHGSAAYPRSTGGRNPAVFSVRRQSESRAGKTPVDSESDPVAW